MFKLLNLSDFLHTYLEHHTQFLRKKLAQNLIFKD